MSSISTNNRRIAKNTLLLYVRMLFLMLVNLYTSRVILRILGVDDYGIYNAVGGIVLMLSFLNSALSNGSSRFITYELGKKDSSCLNIIFCTILNAHLLLAIIVVLIAETVGLWFVTNKLGLAADRLNAALLAYHFSVLTSVATITQVPYTATIIAHERMQIYAYASIFEVVLKLLILYLLPILGHDRLETYAVLLFIVQIIIISIYRVYSIRKFSETKYKFIFNKKKFQEITSFSSWSLLGNAAHALTGQGTNILLQMFFGPKLVAARAISLQVNMAANQFVNNFKLAADPQILMGKNGNKKCKVYELLEKLLGKRNCITLTCCESEDEVAKTLTRRTAYVETGVNLVDLHTTIDPINPEPSEIFTVYGMGRLCTQKQPDLFNRIAELVPEARFVWIGTGELQHLLTAPNIKVTGWKPRHEAIAMGKGAQIYILCSLGEAIAMSLIENMYIGKLCLVSNTMGNKSVIKNGINGYICETAEDYAKRIREAMKKFPQELADRGQKDVFEHYNTERMKKDYIQFYNNAINGKYNK